MEQFIGFKLNSSEYMVPILNVREIISIPSVTALPHLPSYVIGVTNIRGSIIPIISLRSLMNTGGDESGATTVIIISTGKISFGIMIDSITGVINSAKENIDSPEQIVNGNLEQIEGVAKIDDRLIVLLNIKKLLPVSDLSLLEEDVLKVQTQGNGDKVEVTREVETIGGKVTVKELHDAKEYFGGRIGVDDSRHKIFDLMLDFMDALASHDYNKVENVIEQLVQETDSDLFREIGQITRKVHDSIKEFKSSLNSSLSQMDKKDVTHATDNLEIVIKKTEEAANRTMSVVERYYEEEKNLEKYINQIEGNEESVEYLNRFKESLDNDMTDVLTAQQFQDITGQTIKKVIEMVNMVEAEHMKILNKFIIPAHLPPQVTEDADDREEIQQSASEEQADNKVSQSDVENLLSDYGF